ncbi:hypothetical protein GH714_039181 [Hevea brasiliensis]|uniref:Uncharacterized protein n=1 Tax=Hevea brasiliensis TaxID=3981 RepID=A0A6A6MNR0_HEVBR|nr:hypothetical protein GH714_039181 [Hevea brasiliensis]
MSIGISKKKNLDTHCDVPMPTYVKYQKRKKEECMGSVAVDSEKDSESETNSAPVGEADAGHDPNEVDKKAGTSSEAITTASTYVPFMFKMDTMFRCSISEGDKEDTALTAASDDNTFLVVTESDLDGYNVGCETGVVDNKML